MSRSIAALTGLLLLGGQANVVPTAGRYPAEDSETRTFAPARLHTTAAQTNPADSQRVAGAGTNCQEQDRRDSPQENSAHTRQLSHPTTRVHCHEARMCATATDVQYRRRLAAIRGSLR